MRKVIACDEPLEDNVPVITSEDELIENPVAMLAKLMPPGLLVILDVRSYDNDAPCKNDRVVAANVGAIFKVEFQYALV